VEKKLLLQQQQCSGCNRLLFLLPCRLFAQMSVKCRVWVWGSLSACSMVLRYWHRAAVALEVTRAVM
jgi:hypothetical protein